MFSLHEITQRRVCRVVFVLGAVAPTLLTLAWATHSLRPWREADWQRTLSERLHVRGTIEQVSAPRPGMFQLKNVRLSDLRSERPLATLDIVRGQWKDSRPTLFADELRIEAESFSALAGTLATWLSAVDLPAVELQAERLTIEGRSRQTFSLQKLHVRSQRRTDQTEQVAMQAVWPAEGQGGGGVPLRLVVRQRGLQTTATLHTDLAPLPSWLLADLLPSVARCDGASFSGSVRLESGFQLSSGSLRGQLIGLTLKDWLGPDSPHPVRGKARLELEQLSWHGDRVVEAHGNLRATQGAVGHSLLIEAVNRLYCVAGPTVVLDPSSLGKLQPFDTLACEFHINRAGITLAGKCASSDATSGCLLVADGRTLLLEPSYSSLPVAQLVQVLSKAASSWLPASREAHNMAGKLPLPSVGPQAPQEVASRPEETNSR